MSRALELNAALEPYIPLSDEQARNQFAELVEMAMAFEQINAAENEAQPLASPEQEAEFEVVYGRDIPEDGMHAIPVPQGWSVEQAWEAINHGDGLPPGELRWAVVEVQGGRMHKTHEPEQEKPWPEEEDLPEGE